MSGCLSLRFALRRQLMKEALGGERRVPNSKPSISHLAIRIAQRFPTPLFTPAARGWKTRWTLIPAQLIKAAAIAALLIISARL